MNYQILIFLHLFFLAFSSSAQEQRNQYSNSMMFAAPPVYEDPNQKSEAEQHDQFCRELQQEIKDLKNKPLRHSAAKERYQKECIGN